MPDWRVRHPARRPAMPLLAVLDNEIGALSALAYFTVAYLRFAIGLQGV